ncbi:hypothetical protein K353_04333 [Kitasatospora sp. SolWspMP-SS2h]|uniref:hypothetical protein n=1 Tax=Kitasatospora sp. SolWspMP-SS2h TaxID=1305729 RepID=UPI000DBA2520|nr:hypothetical protein [Kitasatospora sp. SolWspMP-SS2h]RAJ38396.1 hypothetical protein K353_04333 [Kitasatospora sp. SolWspMP-SS2h]
MTTPPGTPGRHRRPAPEPGVPPEAAELHLRAIAAGRPVEEVGVFTADGVAFRYRAEYLPDGRTLRSLVRLDSALPFPPPDPH